MSMAYVLDSMAKTGLAPYTVLQDKYGNTQPKPSRLGFFIAWEVFVRRRTSDEYWLFCVKTPAKTTYSLCQPSDGHQVNLSLFLFQRNKHFVGPGLSDAYGVPGPGGFGVGFSGFGDSCGAAGVAFDLAAQAVKAAARKIKYFAFIGEILC